MPKVQKHEFVSKFFPMSCNTFYKILVKAIANKLKKVLLVVIFSNQSAFIFRKFITDNIIIEYGALNLMKTKKRVKNEVWHLN